MTKTLTSLATAFVMALALAFGAAALTGCQTGTGASTATGSGSGEGAAQAYQKITGEEAQALMESESDYVVVDVRTESEYADGHVPGALNIPLDTISGSEVAELPDKDQLIILYCRSGNRSGQAGGILTGMGYTNIVDFGGLSGWPGEIETGLAAAAEPLA